jgi:glycosyltransferase involved in cell wall biosynthesis
MKPVVAAVVPAYNEADRIAASVMGLRGLAGIAEVLVVDDGSTDSTATEAQRVGATVIRLPRNHGKAAALEAGVAATAAAYLLFVDADVGETASAVEPLLEPVLSGRTDMTIATFPVVPGRGGGFGIVVRLSRWGIRRATGRVMAAPLSGQRCLRREILVAALPLARGFGVETALTIDTLRAGFRVEEVPTRMDHRVTQNDLRARLHRLRQLRDVAWALLGQRR